MIDRTNGRLLTKQERIVYTTVRLFLPSCAWVKCVVHAEHQREGQGRFIVHAEREWEKKRVTVSEMTGMAILTKAGSS